jgi:anti-sigma regulatory factor (Ser/Thr protein kinase)
VTVDGYHVAARFGSDPSAVLEARGALEAIRDAVPDDVFDDTRLLVSELVTNSVRHTGRGLQAPIELSVLVTAGGVHVEISDRGPGFAAPEPRAPTSVEASGWGLYLVDRLADRWGTRSADGGSCVWFEIDVPARGR